MIEKDPYGTMYSPSGPIEDFAFAIGGTRFKLVLCIPVETGDLGEGPIWRNELITMDHVAFLWKGQMLTRYDGRREQRDIYNNLEAWLHEQGIPSLLMELML